jgi:hypothetical protein
MATTEFAGTTLFGIKDVADVTLTPLDGGITLDLDSLKVSNIEFTSEEVFARGGHGNAKLIGWDYNREITITLQDALLSMDSLGAIFGATGSATSVVIGPDTFPGYYSFTGTTYGKDKDGKDVVLTITAGKVKLSSNATINLEAEGDPTVFDMTITVLKDDDGNLMTITGDYDA